MASAEDIQNIIIDAVRSNDETIDVVKGPARDLIIDPLSIPLAIITDEVERANRLFAPNFQDIVSAQEALQCAENFGTGRVGGRFSSGRFVFYRYESPRSGETYTVPAGTIVSRRSDKAQYQVLSNAAVMVGNNASSYYNPTTKRFELSVPGEAVSIGSTFDSARGTIDVLPTQVPGWDGVINSTDFVDGSEAEDPSQTIARTRAGILGSDFGTHGGILRSVLEAGGSSSVDASLVFLHEELMERVGDRPLVDVYVSGQTATAWVDILSASANQTTVVLERQPVLSVQAVKVNNGAVSYTLLKDKSSLRESARSTDRIELANAVNANDQIEVEYTYNGLLYQLQRTLFDSELTSDGTRTRLFGTDVLVRSPRLIPIRVSLLLSVQAVRDQTSTELEVRRTVSEYCLTGRLQSILKPSELEAIVLRDVSGVTSVRATEFRRVDAISTLSNVYFNKTELPVFVNEALDVSISFNRLDG